MYVCMYVCMYIHTYIYIYICNDQRKYNSICYLKFHFGKTKLPSKKRNC